MTFSNLANYSLIVIFLLGILVTVRSLPFDLAEQKISQITASVATGSETVLLFSSDVAAVLPKEINNLNTEIFSGAQKGLSLSYNNLIYGRDLVSDILSKKIDIAMGALSETLYQTNSEIGNFESKSRMVFLSRQVASSALTSDSGWGFFDWFLRPAFVPIIFTSYENMVVGVRSKINQLIDSVSLSLSSSKDDIYYSWSSFLQTIFGENSSKDDIATDREQLKQEITMELQKNYATLEPGRPDTMFADRGVVLMQPSGSTVIDLKNIKQLQDSFSDRVLINFFEDGESGVIQPIFRDHLGEKINFVLTPVKK